ncbi:MAG TPA: NADH:flavin oxidoreductase [Phenylobacterium sp.]|uniref:NADH:flavin oxidoreductase n=1 Tax=Phenylobacterium sp. TaxID=1871053 RepID=UPI002D5B4BA7|nr:NADH:flavin oxidoreductase [Phenylobacterium sp.]HZZ66878.1 NADH:flavin oxidoreductase [Phenylobacterium sp.]
MTDSAPDLFEPLSLAHGPALKNRFALAPLTNLQSHGDGTLSDDEFKWLTYRAKGGFALTMTCASHVQRIGQGFPGQLGVFGNEHLPGLTRLAAQIKAYGSIAVVQLHHAGMRSPKELIGEAPVGPSDDEATGTRALSTAEVEQLIEDFIVAAERAETAGFDGVEIHGAHSYILCQFLSETLNRRTDRFGGSPENRARPILQIIDGIRARCGADFSLGLRLSPERFELKLMEIRELARRVLAEGKIDYLDLSLWDYAKLPLEEEYQDRTLMAWFTDLPRGKVRLGCAGKIMTPEDARLCLERGMDFVLLGRAAILHHDYPKLLATDAAFTPVKTPVTADHLRDEGLGPAMVKYMQGWKGFVEEPATEPA